MRHDPTDHDCRGGVAGDLYPLAEPMICGICGRFFWDHQGSDHLPSPPIPSNGSVPADLICHCGLKFGHHADTDHDPLAELFPVPSRPSWEQYALALATTAATRSEDPYQKVGACVLRADFSVASLGYNGAPSGIDADWTNRDDRRKFVIHAETNALRYCRPGEGYMIAVSLIPCTECLKLISAHGIKKVVYGLDNERYTPESIASVAKLFRVEVTKVV